MTISEEASTVRGACAHDCPDTCAMLVTVENGVATKVRGDPDHPFTAGGLCVKVNDYTHHTYSPDRVLYPLRRVGPKGEGRFERISWDDALDEIADRFQSISTEYGSQAILPYSYLGTEGILNGLTVGDPFFHRLGATVSASERSATRAPCTAYLMTLGPTAGMDPESFVHSKFIILWACNVRSTNLHMWPFIKEAQERGAKVVVIDPLRHRTAQSADWYIPIKPGTDGALALGMMNVIVNEGLVDDDYVAQPHRRLRRNWSSGWPTIPSTGCSQITGIPSADIVTLAREYATSQPSAIRIGVAIERNAGGGQAVRSIACLPGLVGAWRHVGGGILQLPLWAFPLNWDVLQRPDLIQARHPSAQPIAAGTGPHRRARSRSADQGLFVYNSNPVDPARDQDQHWPVCARDDLFTVVVSEQFLTDTADYADIVLPATTQLEQFDIMFSWGHFYVSLNNPAIEPLGEAVPNVEMFRRLAERMGQDTSTGTAFARGDGAWPSHGLVRSRPAGDHAGPAQGRRVGTPQPPRSRRLRPLRRRGIPDGVGQVRVQAHRSPNWRATSWSRSSVRATTNSNPAARSTRFRTTSRRRRQNADSRYPLFMLCPNRTPSSTPSTATWPTSDGCRASSPL